MADYGDSKKIPYDTGLGDEWGMITITNKGTLATGTPATANPNQATEKPADSAPQALLEPTS